MFLEILMTIILILMVKDISETIRNAVYMQFFNKNAGNLEKLKEFLAKKPKAAFLFLVAACDKNMLSLIDFLLKNYKISKSKKTLLLKSCVRFHKNEIFKIIFENIKMTITEDERKTILKIASKNKNTEVIQLLDNP